ncbi:MAG: Methyltransferase type 11 [Verrucomicrobia bacterium]|nr:Methyltransferase type 11 [Verrucomicrobiota bacterium]
MESEEYRRMAGVEDTMWYYRALHAHVRRALAAQLGARAAAVLDAGCGTGGLIRRLRRSDPAWSWTGVDLSPLACELARERTHAEIRQASITALPFGDATFDAVVSADVLYHVDDDGGAIREFARVLKPGGVVVVNVPAHRWLWSYHDVTTHAKRRYARGELREKLAAAGLRATTLTHWNTVLLPLVAVRRKLFPAPVSGSDVRAYPAVDALLGAVTGLERLCLNAGASFPFGTSIFAVAKKAPAIE